MLLLTLHSYKGRGVTKNEPKQTKQPPNEKFRLAPEVARHRGITSHTHSRAIATFPTREPAQRPPSVSYRQNNGKSRRTSDTRRPNANSATTDRTAERPSWTRCTRGGRRATRARLRHRRLGCSRVHLSGGTSGGGGRRAPVLVPAKGRGTAGHAYMYPLVVARRHPPWHTLFSPVVKVTPDRPSCVCPLHVLL